MGFKEESLNYLLSRQKELYTLYEEEVKGYVDFIRQRWVLNPVPILNELRDFHDHMARCFLLPEGTPGSLKIIKRQTGMAEGHLVRCQLDCYKYIWYYLGKDVRRKYRLPLLFSKLTCGAGTDTSVLSAYVHLMHEAKDKNMRARNLESTDKRESFKLYAESLNSLAKLDKNYETHKYSMWITSLLMAVLLVLVLVGMAVPAIKFVAQHWDTIMQCLQRMSSVL